MSIAALNTATPASTDNAGQGDDEIRNLKTAIKACWGGLTTIVKAGTAGPSSGATSAEMTALFDRITELESRIDQGLVIGEIRAWIGDKADLPLGWIFCNALNNDIATNPSFPDGSIPNLEGLYLVGADAGTSGGGPTYLGSKYGGFIAGSGVTPAWGAVYYIEYVGYDFVDLNPF